MKSSSALRSAPRGAKGPRKLPPEAMVVEIASRNDGLVSFFSFSFSLFFSFFV